MISEVQNTNWLPLRLLPYPYNCFLAKWKCRSYNQVTKYVYFYYFCVDVSCILAFKKTASIERPITYLYHKYLLTSSYVTPAPAMLHYSYTTSTLAILDLVVAHEHVLLVLDKIKSNTKVWRIVFVV